EGHDVVEHLPQREGHPRYLEIAAGQCDAMPVRDVDLVDLNTSAVQQLIEGAAALSIVAIDGQRRWRSVIDKIRGHDGARVGDVEVAVNNPEARQGAARK